ncbi:unnamed protein product [Taenia asiatica]|uniref:Nucleic acid-binding protein n=1 Tax=Taenia asiatica TaxID=60517 RepID=A0A0R3VV06_TAEAS|nr:unnamed protein product [Taenia asiatica]
MSGGAAVMNIRQSNKDTQVLKVGGEMFDQEGHRVDVTVWFRHRNEALYCESPHFCCLIRCWFMTIFGSPDDINGCPYYGE